MEFKLTITNLAKWNFLKLEICLLSMILCIVWNPKGHVEMWILSVFFSYQNPFGNNTEQFWYKSKYKVFYWWRLIYWKGKSLLLEIYFLHWNFDWKSCFVVFFLEWNEWKNPQFNFSSQNLSIEPKFFKWDGARY